MKYLFQDGNTITNDFEFSFDAEISFAGRWRSINDHFSYRLTPDGFGAHEATFRRRTVNSPWFSGDYQTAAVPEQVKRNWTVRVLGEDAGELQENAANLITWFTQETYNVRYRVNDYTETWLCDTADYAVDYTHVLAHNNQMTVRFNFSTNPVVSRDLAL